MLCTEQSKNDTKFLFLNNARRQLNRIFKVLKEKKKKTFNLESYTQQHSSQKQGEIMSFNVY